MTVAVPVWMAVAVAVATAMAPPLAVAGTGRRCCSPAGEKIGLRRVNCPRGSVEVVHRVHTVHTGKRGQAIAVEK
jgi:hypothetical protein